MTHVSLGKITERGQITLPKRLRERGAFAGARAVVFIERDGRLLIEPVKTTTKTKREDYSDIVDATLADWSNPVHDDLFDTEK